MKPMLPSRPAPPWYREPWPWLLMAGPVAVIIAGIVTLLLAIESSDGLVADDYYKQGMAINQIMLRDRRAHELDYRAQLTIDRASGAVTLALTGRELPTGPLLLQLAHPTRGGMDQMLTLSPLNRTEDRAFFASRIARIDDARWKITLHDRNNSWRLGGQWPPAAASATTTSVVLVPNP
jgi:uncharacterized protein